MVHMFCEVDGIDGESTSAAFPNAIGVLGYYHRVEQVGGTSRVSSTNANPGRSDFKPFVIVKQIDKSSPYLALNCANGSTIKSVKFVVASANKSDVPVLTYTLSNVVIDSVSPQCAVDIQAFGTLPNARHIVTAQSEEWEGLPQEVVAFRYDHIKWEYQPVVNGKTSGSLVTAEWNLAKYDQSAAS